MTKTSVIVKKNKKTFVNLNEAEIISILDEKLMYQLVAKKNTGHFWFNYAL